MIDPIGAGGMATVMRATDLSLGRIVALKILPPEAAANPEHVARFESEARAAAKLDHENVARVFFIGHDEGQHYIAFEFVDGANLRTLIEQRGQLPVAETIQYMLQVASGLAHAASRGVVHRDIKPSNIIITAEGRAKIVDMGLARHVDSSLGGVTQSGVTLGSFDYIAPEQALEPRTADARSDIYSLGCTFYHALTGQAPVPLGTAARKLQAHQNESPPDPRQFNNAIPDSVVGVLGRMMAKDPQHRYQHVEDLMNDLRALAAETAVAGSAIGAASSTRSWRHGPIRKLQRRHTAIWAAASVLAVAAIVAVVEMSRPRPSKGKQAAIARWLAPLTDSTDADSAKSTPMPAPNAIATDAPKPATPHVPIAIHNAADADELRAILRQNQNEVHIVLTGTTPYVLNDAEVDGEFAGIVFNGKRLILESSDPSSLAVIQFKASPTADGRSAAALSLNGLDNPGASVTLRGIRFECTGGPEAPTAAVSATNLVTLDITRCAFVLPVEPVGVRGTGAIVIHGQDSTARPTAVVRDCLFARGLQAIELLSRANVYVQHCCFGPQATGMLHLRNSGPANDSADGSLIRFEHCSALLDHGAVVLADAGAAGTIQVGHCVFSRPSGAPDDPAGAVLIRQIGGAAGTLAYQGLLGVDGNPQRNVYHNFTAIWSDESRPGDTRRAATLEDARNMSQSLRNADPRTASYFRDDDAFEIPQSPWDESAPIARLADALKPGAPPEAGRAAFAVNQRLARLRLPHSSGFLGSLHNVWGNSYTAPAPPSATAPIVRTKIINPMAPRPDAERGIYPTLAHAILDAKTGDTFLIQKNGVLDVDAVRIDRPDLQLTIKAFPQYHPILAFGASSESDAAMFRLVDGELTLEGLEFTIRPTRADHRTQSLVAIAGSGRCTLRDCVLTLEEIEGVELSAVTLSDADSVARSSTERRAPPRVRFENSFIRGKGDLLSARFGRRFELDLDNTLVALDGSLAVAFGGGRELPAGNAAQLRLKRTTALLTEHLLELRANRDDEGRPGALSPVAVTCEKCLFAAQSGRSLVRIDGVDVEEQVKQLINWSARQTVYANMGPAILDIIPTSPDRMPLPTPFDSEKWLAFTREAEAATPFIRIRFAGLSGTAERNWTRSQPTDFRPRLSDASRPNDGLADIGASTEQLPTPTESK